MYQQKQPNISSSAPQFAPETQRHNSPSPGPSRNRNKLNQPMAHSMAQSYGNNYINDLLKETSTTEHSMRNQTFDTAQNMIAAGPTHGKTQQKEDNSKYSMPEEVIRFLDGASLQLSRYLGVVGEISGRYKNRKKALLATEQAVIQPAREMVNRINRFQASYPKLAVNYGKMNEVLSWKRKASTLIQRFDQQKAIVVEGAKSFQQAEQQIRRVQEKIGAQKEVIAKLSTLGTVLNVTGLINATYGLVRSISNASKKGFSRESVLDIVGNLGSFALGVAGVMNKTPGILAFDAVASFIDPNWKTILLIALANKFDKFSEKSEEAKDHMEEVSSSALKTGARLKGLSHGQRFAELDAIMTERINSAAFSRRSNGSLKPNGPRTCGTNRAGQPTPECEPPSFLAAWDKKQEYAKQIGSSECSIDGYTRDDEKYGCFDDNFQRLSPEQVDDRQNKGLWDW